MYGTGINRLGELLDLAAKYDIVTKGGAWFSYGETRLGQGRDNARNYLKEHPEISSEIEHKLMAKLKGTSENQPAAAEPSAAAEASAEAPAEKPAARKPARSAVAKTNIDISVDD